MKYLKLDLNNITAAELKQIVHSLQSGEVIVTPTDTVYGLSCLATNRRAIKKIYQLKKRSSKKPLLILVSSLRMLEKYAHLSPQQKIQWKKVCSESALATTVILTSRQLLPLEIEAGTKSLAIRLPKSIFLIKMIRRLGVPLVSTSFNVSGQETVSDLKNINYYFPSSRLQPDLVIDAGRSRKRKSSRLLDLRGRKIKIIRK